MFYKYRSSHPKVFCKNHVFKSLAKFKRKHLRRSLVLKKTERRRRIKKRRRHRHFRVSFGKILRTPILKNFCKWLLTNLFYENKPSAPKGQEKIAAAVFVIFGAVVLANIFAYSSKSDFPAAIRFHVI